MKYLWLIWAGVWRKRPRTVLTMLCIMTAFVLYGTLHGVTAGFDALISKMSATRLRVMNRVNSIDSLPMAYKAQIEALPNVRKVAYYQTMVGYYQEPKNGIGVGAIGVDEFLEVYPEVVLPDEQRDAMRKTRTGAIIGRQLAEKYGWKIGDRVPISSRVFAKKSDGTKDWAFDIVGVYDYAKGYENDTDEMWINFDYFDEERETRKKNYVLLFFVTTDNPDRAARIAERIDAMFANSPSPTQTMNERDSMRASLKSFGNINFIVKAIIGAVFFTLLFLTGNTMTQSVRERNRGARCVENLWFHRWLSHGTRVRRIPGTLCLIRSDGYGHCRRVLSHRLAECRRWHVADATGGVRARARVCGVAGDRQCSATRLASATREDR